MDNITRLLNQLPASPPEYRNVGGSYEEHLTQRLRAWASQLGTPDIVTFACPAVITVSALLHAKFHGVDEMPYPNNPEDYRTGECFLCEDRVYLPTVEKMDLAESALPVWQPIRPACLTCTSHHLPHMAKRYEVFDISNPGTGGN